MFTLITEQQKKSLYRQYRFRLVSLIALLSSALLIVASVLILPSKIMLSLQKDALSSEKKMYEMSASDKNNQEIIESISKIKAMVLLANPKDTELSFQIKKIVDQKPASLSINNISYTRGQGSPSSITFQGVSKTRSNLIDFFRNLQKDSDFKNSNLPVSSLAKDVDVSYTINLQGDF